MKTLAMLIIIASGFSFESSPDIATIPIANIEICEKAAQKINDSHGGPGDRVEPMAVCIETE